MNAESAAVTPGQAALLAVVDGHFFSDGPNPLQLVCMTEDDNDVECDTFVADVEPGTTWNEFEHQMAKHALAHHLTAAVAARQPQPAPESPGLRADLVDAMLRWSGRDRADVDECASELAAILDKHPMAQPAPGDDGDYELDSADIPSGWREDAEQPAPELAAAMAETRRYREALESVRAIILEGDNSTEGGRLRRSRAVIRAALEGK